MCKLIAIEGLNGAGKTVLCGQIANKLQKQGYRVLIIKAPIYEIQEDQIDHFGPNIYKYLNNGEQFDLE